MASTPHTMNVHVKAHIESDAADVLRDRADIMSAFVDIEDEIDRARAKHGKQNHLPFGTGPNESILRELRGVAGGSSLYTFDNDDLEILAKALCSGTGVKWSHIIFEELVEALAADDEDELEAELIQTAAMATCFLIAVRHQRRERAIAEANARAEFRASIS